VPLQEVSKSYELKKLMSLQAIKYSSVVLNEPGKWRSRSRTATRGIARGIYLYYESRSSSCYKPNSLHKQEHLRAALTHLRTSVIASHRFYCFRWPIARQNSWSIMGNLSLHSAEESDNLRATTGTVEVPMKK